MNDLQQIEFNTMFGSGHSGPETNLGDLAAGIWRRKWLMLLILVVVLGVTAAYTLCQKKMYKAELQMILIQRPTQGKQDSDPDYSQPIPESPESQIAMLQSSAMWERTYAWYQTLAAQGTAIPDIVESEAEFSSNMAVDNPRDSNLIYLSVTAPSRDQATDVANNIAEAFAQWKMQQATTDIQDTIHTLDDEINGVNLKAGDIGAKAAMNAAADAEYAYRNDHGLVNVGTQETSALERLSQSETNVDGLQQDVASSQARLQELKSQLDHANTSIASGGGVRDESYVIALQSQLDAAKIERADEATKVTSAYPGILPQLDHKIGDLTQRLNSATNAIAHSQPSLAEQGALQSAYSQEQVNEQFAQARLGAALAQLNKTRSDLTALPKFDSKLAGLDVALQTATQRYNSLESALNTAQLQFNTATGDIQFSHAVGSPTPYRPNWSMNMALGGVVAIFLALLVGLLMEHADRRVRDIEQVERYKLGPILGIVPPLDAPSISALLDGRTTPSLSENFSVVRTNVLAILARTNRGSGQVVLVTSATKGEGKSLVLSELARTLAEAGSKVIVIDANLRAPSLSQFFPPKQQEGLSNVLMDATPFDEIVSRIAPNLAVLHSGPTPDEPTRLVSTKPFLDLLQSLKARADIILVDSPACDAADALLIAPHADYVIQVIGTNKSSEKSVHGSLNALAGVSNVGIIVNFADTKRIEPHRLVNAAAKIATLEQPGPVTPLTGEIHLLSSDNRQKPNAGRQIVDTEGVPVSNFPGETR